MRLFLDTSSLIKLYFKEDGTERLDKIFNSYSIQEIFLSEISLTEFYSAIYKKVRTKVLSPQNADDIINSFNTDKYRFNFIAVNNGVITTSQMLLEKYGIKGLRALDAIQFATIYNNSLFDNVISDDKLLHSFLTIESIQIL